MTLVAAPIWTSLGLHLAKQACGAFEIGRPLDAADAAGGHPVLVFEGMTPEARLAADACATCNAFPMWRWSSIPSSFVDGGVGWLPPLCSAMRRNARLMEATDRRGASARAIVLGASGFAEHAGGDARARGRLPARFVAVATGLGARAAGGRWASAPTSPMPNRAAWSWSLSLLTEIGVDEGHRCVDRRRGGASRPDRSSERRRDQKSKPPKEIRLRRAPDPRLGQLHRDGQHRLRDLPSKNGATPPSTPPARRSASTGAPIRRLGSAHAQQGTRWSLQANRAAQAAR